MHNGKQRVIIENVTPQVNNGAFPAKRALGETVTVAADIFGDGHDRLRALLCWRRAGEAEWRESFMEHRVNDIWEAGFVIETMEDHQFTVLAWVDHYATWLDGLRKKVAAGQDVSLELREGAEMLARASARAVAGGDSPAGEALEEVAKRMAAVDGEEGMLLAAEPGLMALVTAWADRSMATELGRELEIMVEQPLAAAGAWYELFPRSLGKPGEHGTLADVEAFLPRVAEAGFDVLYLSPIHPIGRTHRKGKNNTPAAKAGDVGSPWAIGAAEGGHTAVHPRLGSIEDFDRLVAAAEKHNIAVAMDIAFQCSPDHPWVTEHPQWFRSRPDGSIQYAENPPKKYQDIYPLDFESEDWENLWRALRDVFLFWADHGVRVFRVDNPHTKSLRFWNWCLDEVRRKYPDAVFLSEAFTRPKVMYRLAKAGFSQSYTYFTWRNSKAELTHYMRELVEKAPRDFFRPNFWPNTPDILPEYLQYGGRPAFVIRLVLAATLSSNWGVYGPAYECLDNQALGEGEEYLDSEKYELKDWQFDAPGNLFPFIKRLNAVRRRTPALLQTWNIRFLESENDFVIFYAKWPEGQSERSEEERDLVLTAVNLDPHNTQTAWLNLPMEEMGIVPGETYMVHDQLGDDKFIWQGGRNRMDFDPKVLPARIFTLRRRLKRETDFDYFL